MVDWIKNKIFGFAGGVVSGFKAALGIHSPSRVIAGEVGAWIPPGINQGMEKEMPNLNSNIKGHMLNMTNKMKAAVKAETSGVNFKSNFTNSILQNFKLSNEIYKEDSDKKNSTDNLTIPIYIAGHKLEEIIVPMVSNKLAMSTRRKF